MTGTIDCVVIGMIAETQHDGTIRRQRIMMKPGYGVTCERMSTNGDARYVADLAASRRGIVDRHHREGIDLYDLDILVNGESIADLPFEDAFSRLLEASGGLSYREAGYDFMAASRREHLEMQEA